jgi:hypothetical protein
VEQPPPLLMVAPLTPLPLQQSSKNSRWQTGQKSAAFKRNNKMQNEINMLEEMIELLTDTRADYSKFYNEGNGAAGTRLRKVMQEVKTSAQSLRLHVQETKNS